MLSWLAIIVILFLLALLLWTFVEHLRFQLPYVPSSRVVTHAMVELAQLKPQEIVMDLGAGDARLLIEAKRAQPSIQAIGYELAILVWLLGRIRIVVSGLNIDWKCQDALKADVSDVDVLFLYVTPSFMLKLSEKFEKELKPGTRIVSHVFRLPGRTAVEEKSVKSFGEMKTIRLYVW